MFFFGKPKVTREQAIQIAKDVAIQEKWPWAEPVEASSGITQWRVTTNTKKIGCNIRVNIRKATGEVVYRGFAPR